MVECRELRVERKRNRGLRIADCGLRGLSPRSSQSPAPSPRPRGISLTEVLIAMGILTVGLLGVASVFPVGGWYMQRAEIADRGSAIAQSVMSDIIARGMMNPESWFVMTPAPLNREHLAQLSVSRNRWQIYGCGSSSGTFTRPFAETLTAGLKLNVDPVIISKQFGSAFVIDPMYAAAAASIFVPNRTMRRPMAFRQPRILKYPDVECVILL